MGRINIAGRIYGNLTAIEYAYTKNAKSYWKCECACGNKVFVALNNLSSNLTRSCGCLRTTKFGLGGSGLRKKFKEYKKAAERADRKFELTLEEFKEITSRNCAYCGSEPSASSMAKTNKEAIKKYTLYKLNGIDRIDSSKGYEKGNIVPCCRWCNIIKSNRSIEDFKNHISEIYNYLN